MKYLITAILLFSVLQLQAQIDRHQIYGSWVKVKLTDKDGGELPETNQQKYSYAKYTFKSPDILKISTVYYLNGGDLSFELNSGSYISVKLPSGSIINQFKIESLKDTLILLQRGREGFDDPEAIKYYFVRESDYQKSINLTSEDVYSINGRDTVYRQNPKTYPVFKEGAFQSYVTKGISEDDIGHKIVGHYMAYFTVYSNGLADSLKVIESLEPEVDKRVLKAFNRSKKNWIPATLNGKPVAVRTYIELRYLTSAMVLPAYDNFTKAREAYNAKDFELALYYLDKALDTNPSDRECLYMRGVCKLVLGNKQAARADWLAAVKLGNAPEAEAMLKKYAN